MQDYKSKTAVITGGTGSFGSAMAEHLINSGIGELRIFSRDEAKQDQMRQLYSGANMRFFLGDVRDKDSIRFALKGADLVFHAAALKQVPSAEFFPIEAVKTNVLGSANVAEVAAAAKVEKLVFLSTDKAVYPINAMGISKALMEKIAQAKAREYGKHPTISTTRYGNVLMSRGSIVPKLIQQIKSERPITITSPSMTRFVMTLGESISLVEYAFENAEPGDLFVKKAGSAKIIDLAKALEELLGVQNSKIEIIGIRHGEKLHESLLSREENSRAIDHGDFVRVPMDTRDLDYDSYFERGDSNSVPDDFSSNKSRSYSVLELKKILAGLPEIQKYMVAT